MRKHYIAAFSRIQKQKQLLMKVPLMMHLYQSIYCYNMHTKADKDFAKRLHFKDIKFPVKVRDFHKIKKRIPLVLVVLVMKIKKKTFNLCIKKCCEEKHVDLLLIEEKGKRHYVPMKVFNTFMYNHV